MTGAGTDSLMAASTVQRPFARVRDATAVLVEVGGRGQGVGREVDEPRTDDRPVAPDFGDVVELEVVLVVLGVLDR
jgi:hypothetical protein